MTVIDSEREKDDLARLLGSCATACWICSERAEKANLDCEKYCQTCAVFFLILGHCDLEICAASLKLLVAGYEKVDQLLLLNRDACQSCYEVCNKHAKHHDHCRRCSEMCREVVDALANYFDKQ